MSRDHQLFVGWNERQGDFNTSPTRQLARRAGIFKTSALQFRWLLATIGRHGAGGASIVDGVDKHAEASEVAAIKS